MDAKKNHHSQDLIMTIPKHHQNAKRQKRKQSIPQRKHLETLSPSLPHVVFCAVQIEQQMDSVGNLRSEQAISIGSLI